MSVVARTFSRRMLMNSGSIFVGETIARCATFLMAVVVAHRFGSAAMGQYGYALAGASVLLVVPDLGMHLFATRELSIDRSRLPAMFWNIHWLKAFLVAVAVVAALAYGGWGLADGNVRLLFYVLMVRSLLQTFSQASMAIFKAFECMQYIAIQQLVNSVTVVVWVAAALRLHTGLPALIGALVAGQAAETFLGWQIIRSRFSPGRILKWNYPASITLMVLCLPIGGTMILDALNLRIDILVLGAFGSNRLLGQFQAAAWFAIGTSLVASLLMVVLFPKLSRLLPEQSIRSSDYVVSLLKNGLLLTAGGALVLWIVAPIVLPLLAGNDVALAVETTRILAPALPLTFLNTALFYVFIAARRRYVCVGVLGAGVSAGLVLSLYFSLRYGVAGCAFANVGRQFIIAAGYLYFLVEGNHARSAGLALLKVFAGATALLLVAAFLTSLRDSAEWLAVWMCFVLVGTLFMLGFPSLGEWRLLTDDGL